MVLRGGERNEAAVLSLEARHGEGVLRQRRGRCHGRWLEHRGVGVAGCSDRLCLASVVAMSRRSSRWCRLGGEGCTGAGEALACPWLGLGRRGEEATLLVPGNSS